MFTANVGGIDRALRLVGGLILLVLGLWTRMASGAFQGTLIAIVGGLLLLSGTVRFCILYVPFGISTLERRPGSASTVR